MKLVEDLLAGDRRALAKAITIVENEESGKKSILGSLHGRTGRAYVIGVTGSPGAGKSSLVDKLTAHLRSLGLTVGIIAVDPTSPFSGGALLGDRIRMQDHALDSGVFIRSMGTRGSLGGLARATKEAVKVLDAFGKDVVLVETVGVGQSELDIMNTADTTVVVLTPGAGDVVQTLKAGIMEIADVFAVNKADMEGANKTMAEVESMLDLDRQREWRPPVVGTISTTGDKIAELYATVEKHRKFLEESGHLEAIRRQRLKNEVLEIVLYQLRRQINEQLLAREEFQELLDRVATRNVDPYSVSDQIVKRLTTGQ